MTTVRTPGAPRPARRARPGRPDRPQRVRRLLALPLLAFALQFGAVTPTAPAGAAWSATGLDPDATGVLVILGIRG